MKQQPDYPANYPAAIKDYSAILEIDPKSIEALYNRAVAHEKLGRTADAVIGYTAVLDADPNHVNAASREGCMLQPRRAVLESY